MENVYSLNPYPLPEKPGVSHHQKIILTITVIGVLFTFAIALYIWRAAMQKTPEAPVAPLTAVDTETSLENTMATLLKTSQVQTSAKDLNVMASSLKKSSVKSNSTSASAQEMASLLKK